MRIRLIWVTLLCLLSVPFVSLSQPGRGGSCSALVQDAWKRLNENCAQVGANEACYGYNHVEATFNEPVPDDFFSRPADIAKLLNLQTIQTAPLDVDGQMWGIALLKVQANIPDTLPGQAVTLVLLGDVAVENQVPPESARQPVTPVEVRAPQNVNIRSGPSVRSNALGAAPAGAVLLADALSEDGEWLRVAFNDAPGWVSRQVVMAPPEAATLPVLTAETRTPMQAFLVRTGASSVECAEAPPAMVVAQGPQKFAVDITVNGADIRISSAVSLRAVDNRLKVTTLSGAAEVEGRVVPRGFSITAALDDDGLVITESWEALQALTESELLELAALEELPADLLNYALDLPSPEDIADLLRDPEALGADGPADDPDNSGGSGDDQADDQTGGDDDDDDDDDDGDDG